MDAAVSLQTMSRDAFFDWVQAQDGPYEFDGSQPVAMTGGAMNHSLIGQNIIKALRARLVVGPCRPLGPDAGIATVGDAVRYPDAVVTCSKIPGSAMLVPDPVIVFEVISASSTRMDRIVKLREYQRVASILRYVIVEQDSMGLTVFERADGSAPWMASALTSVDVLALPEIGASVPVVEFYENTEFLAGDSAVRSA